MPSKIKSTADALRAAIKADGRSQRELAQAAGTFQANLSRFLDRKRSLTLETADALARAIGAEITVSVPAKK